MIEADADELHEILGRQPDRQPPNVERHGADIADAQAGDRQAVLVAVHRAQRFAEGLAHAIAAVGPRRDIGADLLAAAMEAHGMVGRGEDHALHTRLLRGIEEVVAADDIGLQDGVPRALDGKAAEMDDRMRARHGGGDLVGPGQIGGDEGLAGQEIVGLHLVAQHQSGIARRQQGPDHGADAAGGAGEDDLPVLIAGHCRFSLPVFCSVRASESDARAWRGAPRPDPRRKSPRRCGHVRAGCARDSCAARPAYRR